MYGAGKKHKNGPRNKFQGSSNFRSSNPARRMFIKLVKDDKAKIRDKRDVRRFIEGMDTYDSKAELLAILEDKRHTGIDRIEDCLSMLEDIDDIDVILVPLLRNIINDATTRPLYKRILNKIVSTIFYIPGLLDFLKVVDFASASPIPSAETVCLFFQISVETLVEARNSDIMKDMSKTLREREIQGSHKLCALLLVDKSTSSTSLSQKSKRHCEHPDAVAFWVTDLKPPGGRHDNDFENYRDIQLVPTRDEITCDESAWLPLATGENAFIEDPEMRMLDANFRLLREDSVSTMKTNISEQKRVWRNARIIDVCCTANYKNHKGKNSMTSLSFMVQVDLPDDGKKVINWERHRALSYGSVICFCKNEKVFKMGTISERRLEWLNKPHPIIGVTFQEEEDFLSSLQEVLDNVLIVSKLNECEEKLEKIKSTKKTKQTQKEHLYYEHQELMKQLSAYDLIEASTSFFSYKSTLQALKELTSVPLSNELVNFTSSLQRPDYIPSKMIMPAKNFSSFECNLDEWATKEVTAATSLDESQANALWRALTQRVALIQGPPGTGKTFIGSLVAQMIRENTDESILCVCYTNHALDQFLEHLYDAGERKLVRIGGMSKSLKLKPYQVRELAKSKSSENKRHHRMSAVVAQLHQCHDEMLKLIEKLKEPIQWYKPEGGLCAHLQYQYPDIFEYFTIMETQQEDFQVVGRRKNEVMTPRILFEQWKNGLPCPEWLEHYVHLKPELIRFWELSAIERSNQVRVWNEEILADIKKSLMQRVVEYEELNKEKQSISSEQDLDVLMNARVIGATTSGAAKYKDILASKSAGVVIVEEAGEVLEPHVLSALSQDSRSSKETKHLILIGDHLQLRPKVENYRLTTVSNSGYNLDCSLFERLIKKNFPSTMLQTQHRMRPTISEFVRFQTYPTLKDHSSVHDYPSVKGVRGDVIFINHAHPEDNADGDVIKTTKANAYEAKMAVKIVKHFLLQGYHHSQLTVLTPYVGQLMKIVKLMKKTVSAYISDLDQEELLRDADAEEETMLERNSKPHERSVRVSSVDNFQGEEADIIIISLVRSNSLGNIGFLKEKQRVNVLLSRARHGLFIIGNSNTLKRSKEGAAVWTPILKRLEGQGNLLNGFPVRCELHPNENSSTLIAEPFEFERHCPNGGCLRPCKARLECGHVCPKACHPTDSTHKLAHKQCCQPCRRFPPECKKHPCPKLCNEVCGPCEVIIEEKIILPCGHEAKNPKCHDVRNEAALFELSLKCKKFVEHTFAKCRHEAQTFCGNSRLGNPICPLKCGKKIACGHTCDNICHLCSGEHNCGKTCERMLFCGHVCGKECHGDSECPPCSGKCETICVHSTCSKSCSSLCSPCVEKCDWHCEHGQCTAVCGAPCTRLPCQKRCSETLNCGHQCPSLCGEKCPEGYCHECATDDKKAHIADMICFTKYEDLDLDEDPILVLPCRHFFTVSSLDGLFGINQAYQIDPHGNFTGLKSLLENCHDVKPKTCPECRSVVHSVKRYGRLLSFVRLRILERKHIMKTQRSLQIITAHIETKDEKVKKALKKIERDIGRGPMVKVFEACRGDINIEVPLPPMRPMIQLTKLMAQWEQLHIGKKNDEAYLNAVKKYKKAIKLCDASKSTRCGAELRLSLIAKILLKWNTVNEVKEESMILLEWISNNANHFHDITDKANKLRKEIETNPKKIIASVINAMNKVDGYDYGGTWSSHWYECPNGHPYFIGDCGGAMEQSVCIECGESVGGNAHSLLGTNRPASGLVREILDN